MGLLCRQGRGLLLGGEEGPGRLAVGPRGGDGDELPLRVAEGREPAAEDAAGVDVDGAVEPLRLGDRRVPVDDHRPAPVLAGPVEADRQAELVGLAGRLAEEGEVADLARAPALHLLLHPGVGDDEVAVVEDVVADQPVEEVGEFGAERAANFVGEGVDLRQRLGQPVGDLHVLAPQLAEQLHVVVAGDAEGRAVEDHVAGDPHRVEDPGAAVHQVAEEDGLAALGVGVDRPAARRRAAGGDRHGLVAEGPQQGLKLVAAAVDIADEVERPVLLPPVVPERHPLDRGGVDLLRASPGRRRGGSPPCGGPAATAATATSGCGRRAGRSPGRAAGGYAPGRVSPAGPARWPPAGSGTAGPVRPAASWPPAGRWWRR